jgi:hypothetical protein
MKKENETTNHNINNTQFAARIATTCQTGCERQTCANNGECKLKWHLDDINEPIDIANAECSCLETSYAGKLCTEGTV